MSEVLLYPPYPIDKFYKFKQVASNTQLPEELASFVQKSKSANNFGAGFIANVNWRKSEHKNEPRINTNWLANSKLKQTSNDKVYASIKEILNKLNKDTFDKLVKEILAINISTPEHLEELANMIFNKAVTEQLYCGLYAKLCYELLPCCIEVENDAGEKEKYYFRKYLMIKCQKTFKQYLTTPQGDDNESKISKTSVTGCIKFIGELYNEQVLSDKIVMLCLTDLYSQISKEKCIHNIDCICILLSSTHNTLKEALDLTEYKSNLVELSKSASINKRESFALMDLMEKL